MSLYWLQRIYDKLVSGVSVTQVEKDRTITNLPSDMARKAYYDRNSALSLLTWSGYVTSHAQTVRWTYTVPEGKTAMHTFLTGLVYIDIATATKFCQPVWEIQKYEDIFRSVVLQTFTQADGYFSQLVNNANFALFEGDAIRGTTYHNDTIGHGFFFSSILTEFDA